MKIIGLSMFCLSTLLISCNSNDDSKINELEAKLEKQQEEINQAKEE